MEAALLELYAEGAPEDEVAVILRLVPGAVPPAGVRIITQFGNIATCRLPRHTIPRVRAEDTVLSMKRPRLYGPTDAEPSEMDLEPRDSDVRRTAPGMPTGQGMVVAHIDFGVDIAHPDFRHPDGTTRLLALWDQSRPMDPAHPNRYGYGRIYSAAEINAALATEQPYATLGYDHTISDPRNIGTHGTHTLSISAGNGRGGGPPGYVPDAHLLFVHFSTLGPDGQGLLGDSAAFLEALHCIASVAGERPLVVNASIGRQCGQHDGLTLTEQGMDAFLRAKDGRALCLSTGNYYDRQMHARHRLRPGERRMLRFVIEPDDPGPNEIDIWYADPDRFGISIRPPGGTLTVCPPGERTAVMIANQIVGRGYHRLCDPNNHDTEFTLFIDPGAPRGVWELILEGTEVADGRFHAWIERTGGAGRHHPHFEGADPTCTTGTICNGFWTIAVGAYDAHAPDRPLTGFSSAGPTRNGRQKPELVAPGASVLGARSRPSGAEPDAPLTTRMNGTSMAAPAAVGVIAMMFEAAGRPLAIAETRRILLSSTDPPAGKLGLPDRFRFGSGYLDPVAAVAAARALARPSVKAAEMKEDRMSDSHDQTPLPVESEALEPAPAEMSQAGSKGDPPQFGPHGRASGLGGGRLPFQFEIPIGGGPPQLALPIGGAGSPFAFTLPLGGTTPPPAPTGPAAQPATGSAAPAPATPGTAPGGGGDEPLSFPPEKPLYTPPEAVDEGVALGERIVALAEAAAQSAARPRTSAAFLDSLAEGYEAGGMPVALSPLGADGAAPSATALFNALVRPFDPRARRDALHRHYTSRMEVLGRPGEPLTVPPRPGDLLVRVAPGQRWGIVAVVASPGLTPHHELAQAGLRGEGYPRLDPGSYVYVVEPAPIPRPLTVRFARRVCDRSGVMLDDTLLVRLHAPSLLGQFMEAAPEDGAPVAPRPAVLRLGASGEAVRKAQAQVNRVHEDLVALGLPGLPGCPLEVNGRFDGRMEQAVRAFQQQTLSDPALWDGTIGAATQAQLDLVAGPGAAPARARAGEAVEEGVHGATAGVVPTVCQGLFTRERIDHFEFNGATVLKRHMPQIVNVALCVKASRGGSDPITKLTLVGHTDAVGDDAYNNDLGRRRAEAVKAVLEDELKKQGLTPADVIITVETHGRQDLLPGDPALSRRVEVISPRAVPAAGTEIAFVLDDDNDMVVDEKAPVATFLRFGLWNHAYFPTGHAHAGDVRNGVAEADNFIGSERRRFYLRVRDPDATGPRVTARWKTLLADGNTDDDAPASQEVTLTRTKPGSHVYVSKALMLVTDDTDANQDTNSGLTLPAAEAGLRHRGQSNHRLRRARIDGFVFTEYTPVATPQITARLPLFQRTPGDERRRVQMRVINYGTSATAAYIAAQFAVANARWNQVGVAIDPMAAVNRPIPAAALAADGTYPHEVDGPHEQAALADLIPLAADNTLTVVFVPLSGANAYTTVVQRTHSALGNRFFIFVHSDLHIADNVTLAHELSHALFNRQDGATDRQFFTLNTRPSSFYGVPLPDVRVRRRIQDQHNPDPDNDPPNDNIVNWVRRARAGRFPVGGSLGPPTATTGNTLTGAF